MPNRTALDQLARYLADLGERHEGVHFATIGWILPGTHDPDGHEVHLYTTERLAPVSDEAGRIDDARETSTEREHAYLESNP